MIRRTIAVIAVALCSAMANAQTFPSKTVTIVVPFTPGTGADLIARILQPGLSERLKQTVVIDNKVGASGAIGSEFVAKSAPDGHTLLFTATSHGTIPAMRKEMPYDAATAFTPVALAATSAMALVTNPQVDAKNVAELVAVSKKQPGALFYSSPGGGSIQHLSMELVKLETGLDMTHVPYKGSAGAAQDLVGGRVQATVAALQTMAPFVSSNRLRMLAVLSDERSPAFPDVPTMKELGHPGLVVDTWYGVLAPAGTPPEAIATLNAAINEMLRQPEIRAALAKQGLVPVTDKPERLGRLVADELARWKRVVAAAKIEGES